MYNKMKNVELIMLYYMNNDMALNNEHGNDIFL